jgi:hypothetical protein
MGGELELVFWYTAITDVWGHVLFNNKEDMFKIYKDTNDFVKKILQEFNPEMVLVVSDHGMTLDADGGGGSHIYIDYAYYASTPKLGLSKPSLLDFSGILSKIGKNGVKKKKGEIIDKETNFKTKKIEGKIEMEEVKKDLKS